MSGSDERVARVQALLAAEGITHAAVRSAGAQNEIAVVEAHAALLDTLTRLAPSIKALGFRYVAIDLAHADE